MLRGAVPALLLACCLAAAAAGGGGAAPGAGTHRSASTQLATLAASGDVVPLWRAATEAAAAAVVRALEEQGSGAVELQVSGHCWLAPARRRRGGHVSAWRGFCAPPASQHPPHAAC